MISTIDFTNKIFSENRAQLRQEVIQEFLKEMPGFGKGNETSRYEYNIKIIGKYRIYLKRPAQFNNGFDFTLNVEGINFNPNSRYTTRPTHQNIIDDLFNKKNENYIEYIKLFREIENIFYCKSFNYNYIFNTGIPTEILLECIKWLFIEQDITYWNYSGRAMLFNALPKP